MTRKKKCNARGVRRLMAALVALFCTLGARVFAQVPENPDPDFVRAYVVVADPGEWLYTAVGHAYLRLVCADHNLDYVFSYESEDATSKVVEFLKGNLKMAVFAIPTQEYIDQYRAQGRGVRQYELNLPIKIKQDLWQQMDTRTMQAHVPYDYMNRSCAVSVLKWIEQAVGHNNIQYADWGDYAKLSRKELAARRFSPKLWCHFWASTLVGGEAYLTDFNIIHKIIVPEDLIFVLQKASAFGKPLMSQEPETLAPSELVITPGLCTPTRLALLILILALLNLKFHWRIIRVAELLPPFALGLFITYLVVFSRLTCTQWNWLIIPFCPVVLLFWKWRRWWLVPMCAVCFLWAASMLIYPHYLVDTAHIILSISLGVTYLELFNNYRSHH